MVKGMGESSFDDLLPWLMLTLTSESSSVDRSGAAQGKVICISCFSFKYIHYINVPKITKTNCL